MWHILIVDDDFSTRKILNRILHRRALVDHAVDGAEAMMAYELSIHHQDPYDLILLDITMPKIDGTQVLKEIRSREKGFGLDPDEIVPIIMVTGRTEMEAHCRELGCNDYMVKPISPGNLLRNIRKLIDPAPAST